MTFTKEQVRAISQSVMKDMEKEYYADHLMGAEVPWGEIGGYVHTAAVKAIRACEAVGEEANQP